MEKEGGIRLFVVFIYVLLKIISPTVSKKKEANLCCKLYFILGLLFFYTLTISLQPTESVCRCEV